MIDFGALFPQLFATCWWAIPLLVIAALPKSAWFRGVMGEAMVDLAARLFLNKNDHHLINNATIPTGDGMDMRMFISPIKASVKQVGFLRLPVDGLRRQ